MECSRNVTAANSCRRLNWFAILLLVLIFHGSPYANAQHKTMPAGNVNLSPFQRWTSAAECMLNYNLMQSNPCPIEWQKLTIQGAIKVNSSEVADFCKAGGCGNHTQDVLTCIYNVTRGHFWFANHAPLDYVRTAISDGCSQSQSSDINTAQYSYTSAAAALKLASLPLLVFGISIALLF